MGFRTGSEAAGTFVRVNSVLSGLHHKYSLATVISR